MLIVCWSPKGGSGTSVVAAALSVQIAASGRDCLLVDLDGDQPAILGVAAGGQGLTDWLTASDDVPADALRSLEVAVGDRLRLLPFGEAPEDTIHEHRLELVGSLFEAHSGPVVVDAGSGVVRRRWWPSSATTVTVVRSCYLALRRLRDTGTPGDRIVLIEEAGRALTRRDVDTAIGAVSVALPWDPAVARAVDAGLLAHRMPRSLRRLAGVTSVVTPGVRP